VFSKVSSLLNLPYKTTAHLTLRTFQLAIGHDVSSKWRSLQSEGARWKGMQRGE